MLVCQCVSPIILLLGVQKVTTDGDQLLAARNTGIAANTEAATGMPIIHLNNNYCGQIFG